MSDFTIVPQYDYVGDLLSLAPRFGESREFRSLDADDRVCPGLVYSAFAKFMEGALGNQPILDECRNAIEDLASRDDAQANNLLVTEVFEGFRQPEITKNALLPKSRTLYRRWIESPAG